MTQNTIPQVSEIYNLSNAELTDLYNQLVEMLPEDGRPKTIKKFKTVKQGQGKVRKLIKLLTPDRTGQLPADKAKARAEAEASKAKAKEEAREQAKQARAELAAKRAEERAKAKEERANKPRKHKGTNLLPPGDDVTPCREGTKQSIMVDLLSQDEGATMEELLEALSGGNKPWTEVTVRSGFGWDMKQHGYGVRSVVKEGEDERFFLVLPHGVKKVPEHTPRKSAAAE